MEDYNEIRENAGNPAAPAPDGGPSAAERPSAPFTPELSGGIGAYGGEEPLDEERTLGNYLRHYVPKDLGTTEFMVRLCRWGAVACLLVAVVYLIVFIRQIS